MQLQHDRYLLVGRQWSTITCLGGTIVSNAKQFVSNLITLANVYEENVEVGTVAAEPIVR